MDLRRFTLLPVLVLFLVLPGSLAGEEDPARTQVRGNNGTSLKGSARLARNRPVVGATVRIRPENDHSRYLLTSTDGSGFLETLELPDGDYEVTVAKDGLATITKPAVGVKFPFRPVVEVNMSPGPESDAMVGPPVGPGDPLTLDGRILTREGAPVADAIVRLVRLHGVGDPVRIRSGEHGLLAGTGLMPGVWAVEVKAAGFLSIRSTLVLDGPVRLTALLVPQPSGYLAPPRDMLPREQPVAPAGAISPL